MATETESFAPEKELVVEYNGFPGPDGLGVKEPMIPKVPNVKAHYFGFKDFKVASEKDDGKNPRTFLGSTTFPNLIIEVGLNAPVTRREYDPERFSIDAEAGELEIVCLAPNEQLALDLKSDRYQPEDVVSYNVTYGMGILQSFWEGEGYVAPVRFGLPRVSNLSMQAGQNGLILSRFIPRRSEEV
ncbi:MAG TPA: hypothetical protein VG965_05825 [Patescibacteria group bacterium]|nr:hypothetical protein [Patescibacteria group bacterium]